MQWTGSIARTLGQVLLALGIIALVLGVLGLVAGAVLVDRAFDNPNVGEATGDVLEFLVLGGITAVAAGVVLVVAGLIAIGIGRGLRERLERRLASENAGRDAAVATKAGRRSTNDA